MGAVIQVSVQAEDFDIGREYAALSADNDGAVVQFVGLVRDTQDNSLASLYIEHYPGMTERALQETASQAEERWPVSQIRIIHRTGTLGPGEQIVFAGVCSAHREAAFAACEYIMDILKTRAPFWKKETYADGSSRWIDAKESDDQRAGRWQ